MDPSESEIKSTTERQGHGKAFEDWVVDTFMEKRKIPTHTEKWDAEGVTFKPEFKTFTDSYSSVPISIKTCKFNQSVNFGDAIRQFENNQDFLLIVGFWKNSGGKKKVVQVVEKLVSKDNWHDLFIDFKTEKDKGEGHCRKRTREKIEQLDKTIKSDLGYLEARKKAKEEKSDIQSAMTLNPKIDSKKQRRLQCSLKSSTFFEFTGISQLDSSACTFWGKKVPEIKK